MADLREISDNMLEMNLINAVQMKEMYHSDYIEQLKIIDKIKQEIERRKQSDSVSD